MADVIYNSVLRDEATGAVNYGSDTFYAMLVTEDYVPDKDAHSKRSNVTDEITGTGYATGGIEVDVTVGAVDTANDRVVVTVASHNWPAATITARGEVIYKRRGGASSADELWFYNDFGSDVSSTADTFTVGSSTYTKQA